MVELYDVQIISQLGCFKKKIKKGHPGQEKKSSHFNCKPIIKNHKGRPSKLEILVEVELCSLVQGFYFIIVKDSAKQCQVHSWSRKASYLVTGSVSLSVWTPLPWRTSTHCSSSTHLRVEF